VGERREGDKGAKGINKIIKEKVMEITKEIVSL
jgi:hypothetical protein